MTITAFIAVSDTHINSTVGLCKPNVNLDDGGTYHLNTTQSWLWHNFKEFCQEVASIQADRKIVYFGGDVSELDTKRRSVQLITANKATIEKMISNTLEPLYELGDSVIVIRGTQAHVGKGAWIEESFASDLDHVIKDPEHKTSSWYHMRCVIEGVRLDLAHHASLSSLPWGKGNAANNLAKKITWNYLVDMKQPVPHLTIRAHNHRKAESSSFETFVQFLPAWTSATEYAYRTGHENTLADIGGIIFLLDNHNWQKKEIIFKPVESRRVWAMKI